MKFCRDCSTQNPAEATFCRNCGSNIADAQVTAPSKRADTGGSASYVPSAHDYTRLGGWLKFFVVLDFVAAGWYLFSILAYFGIIQTKGIDVNPGLEIIPFVICFISTVLIIKKDSQFLCVRQMYYIINFIFSFIVGVVTVITSTGANAAIIIAVVIAFVLSAGMSVLSFILWTLYFCKSKRVNVYMGGDEYKQKALVKF